jgi:DNA-binding PucR family transcriptional regulator
MHRALRSLGDPLPAGMVDGNHVLILTDQPGAASRSRFEIGSGGTWAAVSAPVEGAHVLPEAMREARFIATLITHGLLPRSVIQFDDHDTLGAFRLMYSFWDTPVLREYRDIHVGPLVREDTRGILIETLRVYLEQGGSQRQTAEVLGIHRNTLGYRLRQIRQLLTVDLDAPNSRLTLHLALIAHKLIDHPVS